MRFRKKKIGKQRHPNKKEIRKYIWKDPSIIEDLFTDQEWQRHVEDPNQVTPSTKMAQYIHNEISQETHPQEMCRNNKFYFRRLTYYAAASVLLIVSLGIWFWIKPVPHIATPLLVEKHEKETLKQDTNWISLTNKKASTQTHTLPDRSTVRLSAKSTIRYPQQFTDHGREIYLEGKAYFSVKKDASRPFSVYANATKTTALGTSFTIDTRDKTRFTSVALHTGKVVVASIAVRPTFENVYLENAGESLSLDASMHIVAHQKGTVKKEASTSDAPRKKKQNFDLLQLNNIPLSEVFVALKATYDISIKVGEQDISKIQYTGNIDPNRETIQDVLTMICLINNLRYVQEPNGSYTIYRQNESINDQHIKP